MLWSFASIAAAVRCRKCASPRVRCSSGENLVIGRKIDEITEIAQIVVRALALGLLPAFILAVLIGMVSEPACSQSSLGSQPKNTTYRGR